MLCNIGAYTYFVQRKTGFFQRFITSITYIYIEKFSINDKLCDAYNYGL